MEYDPEFPLPTPRENEAIVDYLNREQQFMVVENFYENPRNRQIRINAIHIIADGSSGEDPFIPYLAMNYFDRFVSRYLVSKFKGDERQYILLIAISCLTISFKMRRKGVDVLRLMQDRGFEIPLPRIPVTELHILNGLEWRIRSITPFCFLEYYYPKFKQLGGFRRNSINEIIVQSQADHRFTQFKPSDIAFSSLVAAASILYPNQYQDILNEESAHFLPERARCLKMMTEFCNNMGFRIEPADIPTETEEAGNKRKGIMQSLDESVTVPTDVEIPTETEEAGNKGKGIKQSSGDLGRTPTGSESIMAAAEENPLAKNKEITLAGGVATTSAAYELTNKTMTFELRWKEITGLNLTIDPLPL